MPLAPSRPKGPPLNALRAFEAAARLGGFSAAADELSVTPGAVAQHIKTLEEWTGMPLFKRRSQGVELTALGEDIAGEFTAAFDRLGSAIQMLRSRTEPQSIRIAALPSIAQLWLSPRLSAIRKALPDATFSVTVLERKPNLQREPFDMCLFYETADTDKNNFPLHKEEIFPVCCPELATKISRPEDLIDLTCLHDTSWKDDWEHWLSRFPSDMKISVKGPSFSLYSLIVDETINGAGVMIGHAPLVDGLLKKGKLIEPLKGRLTTGRVLTLSTSDAFSKSENLAPLLSIFAQ